MYRTLLLLLCILTSIGTVSAQTVPIGYWREHLPYRHVTGLALAPDVVYCAANSALFSVTLTDHEVTRYSKLNGLHDAGIGAIGYHESSASLVIGYKNGNIDIIRRENIINIPDLLRKQVNGDKYIYHIAFFQDNAYLCTGFGILVLNLAKPEITDTYYPGSNGNFVKVSALAPNDGWFYAATSEGIKRAPLTGVNLANYQNWHTANTGLLNMQVADIATVGNTVVCLQNDTLYSWQQTSWAPWSAPANIKLRDITPSGNKLLVSGYNKTDQQPLVRQFSESGALENTFPQNVAVQTPVQAAGSNGVTYIADSTAGLVIYKNDYETILPNAPYGVVLGDLLVTGNTLWASAGEVTNNWQATQNKNGLYRFENEEWTNYTDLPEDLISLGFSDQTLYAGSFGGGLLSLAKDNQRQIFKQPYIDPAIDNTNAYRVSGMAADVDGNLWLSCYGANRQLAVKMKDGTWHQFSSPYFLSSNAAGQLLIDNAGQKWIVSPKSNGLLVYNHGANIAISADDKWAIYQSGAGRGNLPSNDVRCIAKDKDGYIWVGTDRGVGVIQCPQQAVTTTGCEAYLPVLQEDNFAGYLFRNEQLNTIAVDGANRKWVGTQNGVWLISPNGDKIISRFNTGNSPLLNNEVRKIVVHPTTGEVFFATTSGLVSYRGTATDGTSRQNKSDVLVFPNPVPPRYTGTIAIRGLVSNALVKITDVSGRLVYQTRAQGGQAIWSGTDYTGHRPQSGVYMIFSSDDTGAEKLVTKIVFIH